MAIQFKTLHIAGASLLLSFFGFASLPANANEKLQVFDTNITLEEVKAAQKGWCSALLAISNAYQKGGYELAKSIAVDTIDGAYAYQYGPVAFKPTYAVGDSTFRHTRDGAIAYFVGPDPDIDRFGPMQGFATYRNWKQCEILNDTIQLMGDTANTMGFVKLTDSNGEVAMPEKTWTFWQPKPGIVRIVLHHSSTPFDTFQ